MMRVLLSLLILTISFAELHNGNDFYDMLDGKTVKSEVREETVGETKNGDLFYDMLDGKSNTEGEEQVGGPILGFFGRLVESAWGAVVTATERLFDATGLDNVVHMITHGNRLFNTDGSYNNELAKFAFQNVVKHVETFFDKTGLDEAVHEITGGERVYDPNTGKFDPRIEHALNEAKRIMEVFRSGPDFDFLKKQSQDLVDSIGGAFRSMQTIFEEEMRGDDEGFELLLEVLSGEKKITDPATKRDIENYFNNKAMKTIEKIRYRAGLVDIRGSNGEMIGTVMVGASAEIEFIAGASVGVMAAVSLPLSGTETVEFGGYWSVGLDAGLQFGGGGSVPFCYSWNEKPSGIPGFGITVSTGFSAGPVGVGVDVAWALNTDANEFKLNTICLQYMPGAKFEIAVQASYTGALFDVAKIHLRKPTLSEIGIITSEQSSLQDGWDWCANEGGRCKCYGSIRYGGVDTTSTTPTEKWAVMNEYKPNRRDWSGYGCNSYNFGGAMDGVTDPKCECQSFVKKHGGTCGWESSGAFWDSHDTCSCSGGIIRIGKDSHWSQWMKIGGTSVQCSAKVLGDPWGGVSKQCECGREDVPTTPKCDMPTGCNAAHDRYDNLDCDGDGIPDHVCTTTINSNVWMVLSSEGCPNSWGTSQRSKTLCPRKFPAEQQEETSVAKKEADVTLDSLTTKSFPYHHVTLFFAAIGFAATSYVLYHHCNKEAKYQEVHSEI